MWVLTVSGMRVVMGVTVVVVMVVVVMVGAMGGTGGCHGFGWVTVDDDGGGDGPSGARLKGRDQRTVTLSEEDLL
jgi:hypothetical protein